MASRAGAHEGEQVGEAVVGGHVIEAAVVERRQVVLVRRHLAGTKRRAQGRRDGCPG
jgi:hypothetical protein